MKYLFISRKIWLLTFLLLVVACSTYINQNARWVNHSLDNAPTTGMAPILKVHLHSGGLCVFNKWNISGDTLWGSGIRYSPIRRIIDEGTMEIPFSEVALYEMNQAPKNPDMWRGVALGGQIVGNAIVVAVCIINPKACYGSCPTFYVPGEENIHQTVAEGFSESTMPSLEANDVDALCTIAPGGERFHLVMKNEAFETHAVNELALLAVPKHTGTFVLHSTDDKLYRCLPSKTAIEVKCPKGDCNVAFSKADGLERFSCTDSFDLTRKEDILMKFGQVPAGQYGLQLHFRHTQVSTFLFYSALSYMGDEMVDIHAALDRTGELESTMQPMKDYMGGIEVFYRLSPENNWAIAGSFQEVGPIAINSQLVSFDLSSDAPALEIRLRLAQGNWRLDYAGLVQVLEEISPIKIEPASLHQKGLPVPQWLDMLKKRDDQRLTSMPGEQWLIGFDMPDAAMEYELFLSATGCYLEWNREVWKKEKNLLKLQKMANLDKETWKELAIEFKLMEEEAETVFWNSKVPAQ